MQLISLFDDVIDNGLQTGVMMALLDGKTILVTGGTGSFGKMFTKLVLKDHNPRSIRIYSRGELLQMEMEKQFHDDRLRFMIGDVRDKDRLYRAMKGVDIVVHAAALKHVPACEYNPIEAVKTNIEGAMNVIDAAIDNKVEKVMALSTDKAVHPVNLYGATKMVAEKLFIQGNVYSGSCGPKFSCVRYGNVVGSRGSVVPVFKAQRESGEITITDEHMTRFWITLEQGVRLVINGLEMMEGGEIFIPKIPSMKITDLADVVAPGARVKIIGIRPGEKLHEVLLTEEESAHSKDFGSYYVIEPEFSFWKSESCRGGKPLEKAIHYASDNNTIWLTKEELKKITDDQ
ncbi:MAG TPA: UDP-N-acetylglucosamine 4,6-dehydratase (inverting) [Methanocella sp.]